MLIPKPDIRIVTRKVTLQNGAEALAYFAVVDTFGVLEVKFLGTKAVEASVSSSPVLLLDSPCASVFGETVSQFVFEWVSPFFTLDFLTSQLARAPSAK